MQKINVNEIQERERQSPNGKFGRASKDISIALGRDPESFDLRKRHPFDLAMVRIPKGRALCPYHSHSAESELYLVVSGKGSIRDKEGTTTVTAGDAFFFGPGEAHQLTNAGEEDCLLRYRRQSAWRFLLLSRQRKVCRDERRN